MQPVVSLECPYCQFKTISYGGWQSHLLEERHQVTARDHSKFWDLKDMSKAVVVFGVLPLKREKVLKYFSDLGFVIGFVFWNDRPDFCLITFFAEEFARNVVSSGSHKIDNHLLVIRRREEITDPEWTSIFPFLARAIKQEMVTKEDVTPTHDDPDRLADESEDAVPHQLADSSDLSGGRKRKAAVVDNSTAAKVRKASSQPDSANAAVKATELNPELNCEDGIILSSDEESVEATRPNQNPRTIGEMTQKDKIRNRQLNELYNDYLHPAEIGPNRILVRKTIELKIGELYPNCVLTSLNGFADYNIMEFNFIDFHLDLDGSAVEIHTRREVLRLVSDLRDKLLPMFQDEALTLNSNKSAYLGFKYTQDNSLSVRCRILIDTHVRIQWNRILEFMFSLDGRVLPLLILTWHWAYFNKLTGSNPEKGRSKRKSFNKLIIECLVIYFLTMKKIVPSISSMQQHCNESLIYKGVNIAFCNDAGAIGWTRNEEFEIDPATGNPSANCILSLFMEMLQCFGKYNYSKSVLNVNIGKRFKKGEGALQMLDNTQWFSGKALQLTNRMVTRNKNSICIQHPLTFFNTSHALSPAVKLHFKRACNQTAEKVQSWFNDDLSNAKIFELLINTESNQ